MASGNTRTLVSRYNVILWYAGGFLPECLSRVRRARPLFDPDAADPASLQASFQRFYFDTALNKVLPRPP